MRRKEGYLTSLQQIFIIIINYYFCSSFYKKMRGDNGHGPVNNWCRQPVCQINEAIKNNDSWTSESGRTYNGSDLQTFQDDLYEFG